MGRVPPDPVRKGLTMYNRSKAGKPLLADAFDDWIDEATDEKDQIVAMLHFMAGAGAVVGMIQTAYGTGRSDAAGRIFARQKRPPIPSTTRKLGVDLLRPVPGLQNEMAAHPAADHDDGPDRRHRRDGKGSVPNLPE